MLDIKYEVHRNFAQNGRIYFQREGKDGNLKIGVPDKKDLDVGLLVSYSDSGTMRLFNTPSTTKLKNPTLPIWVICSDDKWGVLFSPNADLLKQYTKE